MNWRTRIAHWLLPRERLTVVLEEGKDGRWRWYAYTFAQVLVAQSAPDGHTTESGCASIVRKLFGNGWRVSVRVEYPGTAGERYIPPRETA